MTFYGVGVSAWGFVMFVTTPNHPAAEPTSAAVNAAWWLLGVLGIIVGLAMVLTDVLFGHQPATPRPPSRIYDWQTEQRCKTRRGESVWSSWCQCRECVDTREASR